jgi:phage terminase small subunit
MSDFGLTPTSRARLGSQEKPKPEDEVATILFG